MCRRCLLFAGLLAVVATTFASSARGELIANGDFELGNFGFTSEYELNSDLEANSGRYNVGSNPQSYNPFFAAFSDHTSTGPGNMLIVNGDSSGDPVVVWSETVAVDPGTSYHFSYWVTPATAFDTSQFRISINGADIALDTLSGVNAGDWQNFNSYWNSGLYTSAQINIYEETHAYGGNDFALDDISFGEGVAPVPEPSSLALVGLAAGGAWWKRRRTTGVKRLQKLLLNCFAFFIVAATALVPCGEVRAGLFTGLGDLTGGTVESYAYDISADGSTIVGYSGSGSGQEGFRWTIGGGMVGLGDFSGGTFTSIALGVSADGSVITGYGDDGVNSATGFVYSGGPLNPVGDLPGGLFTSIPLGISDDGTVIAGISNSSSGYEGFRWVSGSMSGIGDLAGGGFFSTGYGASPDGTYVLGYGTTAAGTMAVRHSTGGGLESLGELSGGAVSSVAVNSSTDGSVIVGNSVSGNGTEAFRWVSGFGMSGLGDLAGGTFESEAVAVSGDGSVVVGYGTTAAGQEAFYWDSTSNTMRLLSDVLTNDYGLDLSSFQRLTRASGISADGTKITGYGINLSGDTEAFYADLSAVPEPSSLALVALAASGAWWKRRRLRETV